MDDFVIEFYAMKSLKYFVNALQQNYEITTNMEGDWIFTTKEVKCSMPGYLPMILICLLHISMRKQQDSQHPEPQVTNGKKIQLALEAEDLPILEKDDIALTQKKMEQHYTWIDSCIT